MEQILSAFLSGRLVYMILVPFLRALASGLLAIAIARDCKARRNGSSGLWALLAFLSPLFTGIVYFVYSRFLTERKPESPDDRHLDKSAKKLVIWSAVVYVIAFIIAVSAVITMAASGIAAITSDEFEMEDIVWTDYYDRNGVAYEDSYDVPLYDREGNVYTLRKIEDSAFSGYDYFDRNGNEYILNQCYISRDGYFYYDSDESLVESKDLWYYDKTFYDKDGNEYATVGERAFWDQDGRIWIQTPKYAQPAFDDEDE